MACNKKSTTIPLLDLKKCCSWIGSGCRKICWMRGKSCCSKRMSKILINHFVFIISPLVVWTKKNAYSVFNSESYYEWLCQEFVHGVVGVVVHQRLMVDS